MKNILKNMLNKSNAKHAYLSLVLVILMLFFALPISLIAHESSETRSKKVIDSGQGVGTTTEETTEAARDADGNLIFIVDPDTGLPTQEVLYLTTTKTVTYTYTWYSVEETVYVYQATHTSGDPDHEKGWWGKFKTFATWIIPFI